MTPREAIFRWLQENYLLTEHRDLEDEGDSYTLVFRNIRMTVAIQPFWLQIGSLCEFICYYDDPRFFEKVQKEIDETAKNCMTANRYHNLHKEK